MKSELVAIPVFDERISPLLDVSERFVLFEVKDCTVAQRIVVSINAVNERSRIQKLKELGVAVIISGAVSRYLSHIIMENGIRHIPWISGPVDAAIESFLNNTLHSVLPENGSCGGMIRKRKRFAADYEEPQKNKDKKEIL